MAAPPDDMETCPSSTVSITVLTVKPVKFGKIFALASVEIDVDGVLLVIHGVQATRVLPMGTRIDLPMFRDEAACGAARQRYLMRFAGQLARQCWTRSSSAVWRSEVPRCELTDFVKMDGRLLVTPHGKRN